MDEYIFYQFHFHQSGFRFITKARNVNDAIAEARVEAIRKGYKPPFVFDGSFMIDETPEGEQHTASLPPDWADNPTSTL